MTEDAKVDPAGRFQWSPKISLGEGIMVLTLIGSIGVWAMTQSSNSSQTMHDLNLFQTNIVTQLNDLKLTVDKRFGETTAQISALPTVSVLLAQMERRMAAAEDHISANDKRLNDLERITDVMRSDLTNIGRASSIPSARAR